MNPKWNSDPVMLTDEAGTSWRIEWDDQDGSDKILIQTAPEEGAPPQWEHIGDANEKGLNIWHADSDMCDVPWEIIRILHLRYAERTMWVDPIDAENCATSASV